MLPHDVFHDGFHEAYLEVKWRLHAPEGQAQQTVAQALRQPGRKTLHYHIELSVGKQLLEGLLHFLGLVRTNIIKFRRYGHNNQIG